MVITRNTLKEVSGADYYDGSVLHNRFAYKFLKKNVSRGGDIISFVAPMEVTINLIDLEDSINKDYIFSESAINFLIEIPSVDLFGGICFQRLFNAQLGTLLCSEKFCNTEGFVDGDDIMIHDGSEFKKASVSIAAEKNGAVLIHVGINIKAGDKAPNFAYSTNLNEEQINLLQAEAVNMFYRLTQDIFVASSKVVV
jgi:hypothetical protein